MPTIRKLDADEGRRGGKPLSARTQVQREYDAYLAEFAPDEYGEAVINDDESKLTVRNRLRAAAERRGLDIDFLRTPGPAIRFQLTTPSAEQASGEDSDEVAESGAANESSAEGGAESNGGSGNSQEEEQFRQQEQAEGPQPKAKRRQKVSA